MNTPTDTLALILTLTLSQNVVLVHYLGLYPLNRTFHSPRIAFRIGVATTAALLWIGSIAWVIRRVVLVPLDAQPLWPVILAIVIGVSVPLALRVATLIAPFARRSFRRYIPLVGANVTVFVLVSALAQRLPSYGSLVIGCLAGGTGLTVALILVSAARVYLDGRRTPSWLKGDTAIYLTLAVAALAVQQLAGVLQPYLVPLY